MPYNRHYTLVDPIIEHVDTTIKQVTDPFILSRYIGLISIAAVTAYELCIKDIFYNFSLTRHAIFGTFVQNYFSRINGRINIDNIKNHLTKFGDSYKMQFEENLQIGELYFLKNARGSIKSSYKNIILWRHQFAHEGNLPLTVTYPEAVDSYQLGKEVVKILAETMK